MYPALAVVEALYRHNSDGAQVVFVGTSDGFERPLLAQSGVTFSAQHAVMAGPLNGVGVGRAFVSLLKLGVGVVQAFALLLRYRPKALLMTGGWANVPLAVAGWVLRVPMLAYLPDIEPALTLKALSKVAGKIAVTVGASSAYFREGQTVVTGYPLRETMLNATREAGLAHFQLDGARPVLLVFGGSRGARRINLALERILPDVLALGVQVLHVTGTLDWERSQGATAGIASADYRAFPYLHDDMGLAMACADLAVCRAGASTLGELPHFGLPSVLVPLADAWRYQQVNAEYLASHGAGVVLADERMADELLPLLRQLLTDTVELKAMATRARALAVVDGAKAIADVWQNMAGLAVGDPAPIGETKAHD